MPVSFNAICMRSVWINFVVIILGSFAHPFAQDMFMLSVISSHSSHINLSLTYTFMGHNIWALWAACCPSVPIALPTSHPLNSSLDKEGSLFLMDSICFFPIPTVGNMETPPLISLFTAPPFPPPTPLHLANGALYDIIYLWMLLWEWDAADADFFCYHPTCFSEGS